MGSSELTLKRKAAADEPNYYPLLATPQKLKREG